MASSKGKAKDRPERKRITERIPRPSIRSRVRPTHRKRANTPYRRQLYDTVSIPQLVYELLTIDKYNQEAKRRSPERFRTSPQRMRRYHERQRLPYEAVDCHDSSESIQVPEYAMESRPTSTESLTEVMNAANSSAPISSANSSVSNISMEPVTLANSLNSARALFKKKSLVQLVNNYIKAGIEEGKRQAKKYVRKALSFGVRSGYLIPTDPRGNVLRVCPTLTTSSAGTDADSRRKRRIARRGQTRLTTVGDRKAMRRGVPVSKQRHDATAEATASTKRNRRRHSDWSPERNARRNSPRKSPNKSTSREKKSNTGAQRKSRIDDKANNGRSQQRKRGDREDIRKSAKIRRTTAPKRVEDQCEPIEESCNDANDGDRDQYIKNEDNYREGADRRESTSSREDEPRTEKQRTEINADDNRDVERKNNDDEDGKSEEVIVEMDT